MLGVILIGLLVLTGIEGSDEHPGTPQEQYRVLEHEHDVAFQAWAKANREAKTEAELAKLEKLPVRNARNFAGGFMALARKYPGTEAAEDALIWVASHVAFGPETEEAKRLLIRDHILGAKMRRSSRIRSGIQPARR